MENPNKIDDLGIPLFLVQHPNVKESTNESHQPQETSWCSCVFFPRIVVVSDLWLLSRCPGGLTRCTAPARRAWMAKSPGLAVEVATRFWQGDFSQLRRDFSNHPCVMKMKLNFQMALDLTKRQRKTHFRALTLLCLLSWRVLVSVEVWKALQTPMATYSEFHLFSSEFIGFHFHASICVTNDDKCQSYPRILATKSKLVTFFSWRTNSVRARHHHLSSSRKKVGNHVTVFASKFSCVDRLTGRGLYSAELKCFSFLLAWAQELRWTTEIETWNIYQTYGESKMLCQFSSNWNPSSDCKKEKVVRRWIAFNFLKSANLHL